MRVCVTLGVLLMLGGCVPSRDEAPMRAAAVHASAETLAAGVTPVPPAATMPAVGIAVLDTAFAWCAEFPNGTGAPPVRPGQQVAIVFVAPAAVPARRARVVARRAALCPSAFPQPRWTDYLAFDLELIDSLRMDASAARTPVVALAVASAVPWRRGDDGVARADLDGDGRLEEARRCTADEGEHFTLWTQASNGRWVRRVHEYFDWGGLTEPTCRPGEAGEEVSRAGATSPDARQTGSRREA